MRYVRLAGLLLLSQGGLIAGDFNSRFASLPERAGIPVAYVNQRRCTILSYKGDNPIVSIDGSPTEVRKVPVSIIPGGEFGPGIVKVEHGEAVNENVHTRDSTSNGPTYASYTAFYAKMTADRDLPDTFLFLLVFEPPSGSGFTQIPRFAILGSSIGNLEAGKTRVVKADFPPMSSKMELKWVALLFSRGVQVRTSDGNGVLDALFDLTDHVGQARAIARRSSGNFPLEVYRKFPLRFQDEDRKKYAGQTLVAEITIAPRGNFDVVRLDGVQDEDLTRELALQFGFWLFLPPVKDGQTQSTTVALPLKF